MPDEILDEIEGEDVQDDDKLLDDGEYDDQQDEGSGGNDQDHPEKQEIEDYAKFLGMDPNSSIDRGLFYIAKQGLMEPVPEPWEAQRDANDLILYYNADTGEESYQHPCDDGYRQLFKQKRAEEMKKRGLDVDEDDSEDAADQQEASPN